MVFNFQKSDINIMKLYKNMIKSVMLHEYFVKGMKVFDWLRLKSTVLINRFFKSARGVDEIVNCTHSSVSVVHAHSMLQRDSWCVIFKNLK